MQTLDPGKPLMLRDRGRGLHEQVAKSLSPFTFLPSLPFFTHQHTVKRHCYPRVFRRAKKDTGDLQAECQDSPYDG